MNEQDNRLPLFLTPLTHIWGVATMCILWVLSSIFLSLVYSDWQWFARSGSILVLGGAILAIRSLLRRGPKEIFGPSQPDIISGGHATPTPEEIECLRQSHLDAIAAYIGFWFIVIGTGIWGYGDLIG